MICVFVIKKLLQKICEQEGSYIPEMNLQTLKNILFHKLKLNKACDIFNLTVEHICYSGDESLLLIINLINNTIINVNYLSSPQLHNPCKALA